MPRQTKDVVIFVLRKVFFSLFPSCKKYFLEPYFQFHILLKERICKIILKYPLRNLAANSYIIWKAKKGITYAYLSLR